MKNFLLWTYWKFCVDQGGFWQAFGAAMSAIGPSAKILGFNQWVRERNFAEQMANTAHQREVVDLKAAGLNPILSATGGAGAPAPSAPTYDTGGNPDIFNKVIQAKMANAQLANVNADTELKRAQEATQSSVKDGQEETNKRLRSEGSMYQMLEQGINSAKKKFDSLRDGHLGRDLYDAIHPPPSIRVRPHP